MRLFCDFYPLCILGSSKCVSVSLIKAWIEGKTEFLSISKLSKLLNCRTKKKNFRLLQFSMSGQRSIFKRWWAAQGINSCHFLKPHCTVGKNIAIFVKEKNKNRLRNLSLVHSRIGEKLLNTDNLPEIKSSAKHLLDCKVSHFPYRIVVQDSVRKNSKKQEKNCIKINGWGSNHLCLDDKGDDGITLFQKSIFCPKIKTSILVLFWVKNWIFDMKNTQKKHFLGWLTFID